MFMANLMADALEAHGFFTEIVNEPLASYSQHDVYIVLSANAYELNPNSKYALPPADKRLVVQLEQQSSDWFKEDYFQFLRESYAVLEYNFENIEFLQEQNIKEVRRSEEWGKELNSPSLFSKSTRARTSVQDALLYKTRLLSKNCCKSRPPFPLFSRFASLIAAALAFAARGQQQYAVGSRDQEVGHHILWRPAGRAEGGNAKCAFQGV